MRIMSLLYNLAIYLYFLVILAVSPFNSKAALWIKGRKNIFYKLKEKIGDDSNIAWFHCSSLGEFEQGRPVIEEFKRRYSSYRILLTFFSPSGYEIRKNYKIADYVFYLPSDTRRNARKFLKIVNPRVTFFVKYEFWRNYLNELKKNKMKVYIFSANFREGQLFFKPYGKWYKDVLLNFDHIFVLNENSSALLKSCGINNVTVSGDTRFDRVKSISENFTDLPLINLFKDGKLIFIAGSTWEKDIKIISEYINSDENDLKFIIAPHEIKQSNISYIFQNINKKIIKYSEADTGNIIDKRVLVIDNIGMLSSLYRYADIAFVGGGFDNGIHNLLEAAVFGLPVIFGPNNKKFIEAQDLIRLGAGFEIASIQDMKNIISDYYMIDKK